MEEAFRQHPDAEVLLSFTGLGVQLAARVLSQVGDDRTHFADARGLKAYAGSSPVTRASGKKSAITRRWVTNDRRNHAGYLWAFSALRHSPGAGAHYRRRREQGDWHTTVALHTTIGRVRMPMEMSAIDRLPPPRTLTGEGTPQVPKR